MKVYLVKETCSIQHIISSEKLIDAFTSEADAFYCVQNEVRSKFAACDFNACSVSKLGAYVVLNNKRIEYEIIKLEI